MQFSILKNSVLVLFNTIFFLTSFFLVDSILKLFIEEAFNDFSKNFLLVLFTFGLIGLGLDLVADLGLLFIHTLAALLTLTKFLNLLTGFLVFLFTVEAAFLIMDTSTILFDIDKLVNLSGFFSIIFITVFLAFLSMSSSLLFFIFSSILFLVLLSSVLFLTLFSLVSLLLLFLFLLVKKIVK